MGKYKNNHGHSFFHDALKWSGPFGVFVRLADSFSDIDRIGNEFLQGLGELDASNVAPSLLAKYAGTELTGAEREANQFSAEQAYLARQHDIYMSKNKYQMETQSMQNAGLNPAMMYGGGNLVSTHATGAAPSSVSPSTADLLGTLMALVRMPLEMKNLQAQNRILTQDERGKKIDNDIKEQTSGITIELVGLSKDEALARIAEAQQRTKTEEERTALTHLEKLRQALDNDQFAQLMEWNVKQAEANYNLTVSSINEKDANAALLLAKAGLIPYEKALLIAQAYYNNQAGAHAGDKSFEQWFVGEFGDDMAGTIRDVLGSLQEWFEDQKNKGHGRNKQTREAVQDALDSGEELNLALDLMHSGE